MREASVYWTATIANPTLFFISLLLHVTRDSSSGGQKQTKLKMKRFFTMIVAACAFLAASAQYPMVTLSHNGELSFFTNQTAFETALGAAENGDILYLSEGDFIVKNGSYAIKKRVSIVGTGYRSHILGNLTIDMYNNPNSWMAAPLFDGVRLNKLSFSGSAGASNNLGESEIRRCRIGILNNGGLAGTEVTFDGCYIESADFQGSNNVILKNSKFKTDGFSSGITAINCNILCNDSYIPKNLISCILQNIKSSSPSANGSTAINSLFNFTSTSSNFNSYDCYYLAENGQNLLDDNLECLLDLTEAGYLGQDGTVVGIHGGENPFSENPSVPTVDSAKSSVEYDAAGNKLKVSITVKAD